MTDEQRDDELESAETEAGTQGAIWSGSSEVTVADLEAESERDAETAAETETAAEVDSAGAVWPDVVRSEGALVYDCSNWATESRVLLGSMLNTADVPLSWQGSFLSVPEEFEETVGELIDVVLAAAMPPLDPTRSQVVYEVGTWSSALQTGLAESLSVAGIAYAWDEAGDLVIYEDDEDRVEEIFDAMPDPTDDELAEADVDVQQLLTTALIAAEKLAKKPLDSDATLQLVGAAELMERISLPFGFEPAVWRELVTKATDLSAGLSDSDPETMPTDDELKESAALLRTVLRQFV